MRLSINMLVIGLCCQLNVANAQQRIESVNHDGWYMYFGNHQVTDKISIHTEYQWRRNQWIEKWQQSLLRLGVDYHIRTNAIVSVGYGSITTFPYGEQHTLTPFHENRIWQSVLLKQNFGRAYLSHRYRLEQRFVDAYKMDEAGSIHFDQVKYANRMRYMLSITLPLNKKEIQKDALFIRCYDEAFVSFGSNVQRNIFDQNRLYIALGYQLLPATNIQAGYMDQLIFKGDGIHYENNHTLQVSISHNLDFRKAKVQDER